MLAAISRQDLLRKPRWSGLFFVLSKQVCQAISIACNGGNKLKRSSDFFRQSRLAVKKVALGSVMQSLASQIRKQGALGRFALYLTHSNYNLPDIKCLYRPNAAGIAVAMPLFLLFFYWFSVSY